jgi:hypothetical protein
MDCLTLEDRTDRFPEKSVNNYQLTSQKSEDLAPFMYINIWLSNNVVQVSTLCSLKSDEKVNMKGENIRIWKPTVTVCLKLVFYAGIRLDTLMKIWILQDSR